MGIIHGDWIIWSIAFVSLGGPVLALTLDRAVGISGRLILLTYGLATVFALTAIGIYGALADRPIAGLVLWGVAAGLAATAALDMYARRGLEVSLVCARKRSAKGSGPPDREGR